MSIWRRFEPRSAAPHGPRFVPRDPPAEDLAAYVSQGVSTRAYATHAVLRLLVPLEEAARRVSPSTGTLRAARTAAFCAPGRRARR